MSGEGVAIQCPNLVFTLAVYNLHVLAHGFLGRGKAESLVGYGEHAAALLGVDGNVGCKTYEAIIKGENIPEPGIPESFKVLLKELQALGLDVKLYRCERQSLLFSRYRLC